MVVQQREKSKRSLLRCRNVLSPRAVRALSSEEPTCSVTKLVWCMRHQGHQSMASRKVNRGVPLIAPAVTVLLSCAEYIGQYLVTNARAVLVRQRLKGL